MEENKNKNNKDVDVHTNFTFDDDDLKDIFANVVNDIADLDISKDDKDISKGVEIPKNTGNSEKREKVEKEFKKDMEDIDREIIADLQNNKKERGAEMEEVVLKEINSIKSILEDDKLVSYEIQVPHSDVIAFLEKQFKGIKVDVIPYTKIDFQTEQLTNVSLDNAAKLEYLARYYPTTVQSNAGTSLNYILGLRIKPEDIETYKLAGNSLTKGLFMNNSSDDLLSKFLDNSPYFYDDFRPSAKYKSPTTGEVILYLALLPTLDVMLDYLGISTTYLKGNKKIVVAISDKLTTIAGTSTDELYYAVKFSVAK